MESRVSVFGLGYVGLVTATCFAECGHQVIGVEINEKKLETLRLGHVPLSEPGLTEKFKNNVDRGELLFTSSALEAINQSEDLVELYDLMDVFFFLSRSEGLSMTLLEAMRQSKPVIASHVGGNPEVVETKQGCETGILIQLEDSDDIIIEKVAAMLSDKQHLKEMGEHGKARMQKLFIFERMMSAYEVLYKE